MLLFFQVTITPEVTLKKYSREIISHLFGMDGTSELRNRLAAYDGCKSLYTAGALPFEQSKEFLVKFPKEGESGPRRRELEFKVVLKLVAMRTLQAPISGRPSDSSQEIIQALDIVMRSTQSLNRFTPVGRSFFSKVSGDDFLGKGIVYWRGFYQSIRPTQMGLSLNIDASATAFYEKMNVARFVEKQLGSISPTTRLSNQDCLKLKKVLKGLRVRTDHCGNRDYKVTGLSILPSDVEKFSLNEGVEKTVAQYFREKYKIPLKYPSLPCLKCGSSSKPVLLPMEVCNILEGQKYSRKLDMQQVIALLKATCQRPYEREQTINKMVKDTNYNADNLVNSEFKLQVADKFTTFEARVLPPPTLNYGRNDSIAPNLGAWNMIDKQMFQSGSVGHWRCINFSESAKREVANFCTELADMCSIIGMDFNKNPTHGPKTFRPELVERALEEVHTNSVSEKKLIDLLLIILPDGDTQYGKIKRICETKLGIVSQCCKPQKVVNSHGRKQYLANIALKINVKAGGCNAVLKDTIGRKIPVVTDRRTIVFGADVTHPSPGEDSCPSIAAVVASMDFPGLAKYKGLISAQSHRQEIIQDLSGMVRELLVSFAKVNGGEHPESIIFYRDGVSEGQFAEVLHSEMGAIRTACQSIKKDYLPYVTFIVVQKRHHTRLFPADEKMQDRNGNVLPGTVVDTQICHPSQYDFYLCSHAGIQGTNRPTHYHVLFDENHFAPDLLQLFTNSLCYTFARCTRSVSVVPAAYYAHLLAFRARHYIDPDRSDAGSSRSGVQGSQANDNAGAEVLLPSIKGNVQEVMFYC